MGLLKVFRSDVPREDMLLLGSNCPLLVQSLRHEHHGGVLQLGAGGSTK